ncbi:MAG: hypothetical protein LBK22_08630 [Tannerella sp.]|jgi:hypothetical protein|nr:hypothetical protein [Tannerella sp.]
MNKKLLLTLTAAALLFGGCTGSDAVHVLGDASGTHLSVDLCGGSLVDFRLEGSAVNPFSWSVPASDMPENNRNGAPFRGHFLCLGRWGAPTDGERRAGVPHNGQAGNGRWQPIVCSGDSLLVIRSEASLDGIAVVREIRFDAAHAVFRISDAVESRISIGRPFNMVQHATFGIPFLTRSTLVDSNAGEGFMQHLSYPDPHRFAAAWPMAIVDTAGHTVDLTRTDSPAPYVSTHLFPHDTAWVTAAAPGHGLLAGYVWKTSDYPWLNVWHDVCDGQPAALGLEFGTTGIGRPYQELLAIDTRFRGQPSFFYLDALETVRKPFIGFQARIPGDYRGVQDVALVAGRIVLTEKAAHRPRIIIIENRYSL